MEAQPATTEVLDPKEVEGGRLTYLVYCKQCHGLDAEGHQDWGKPPTGPFGAWPPPPHDSSGHTWHHGDGTLLRIISEGGKTYEFPGFVSKMPAFGDRLKPEEIKAVLTYFKSLWKPDHRAFQAAASINDPFH